MPRKKKESLKPTENQKKKFTQAIGRRKRSVARIRLFKGKSEFIINGVPISRYFCLPAAETLWLKPFELTKTEGKYHVLARIEGGGKSGQLGAFIHGVSRALVKENESFRPILKKERLLRRDPREKERRKPGLAQKARAKKQSPKR